MIRPFLTGRGWVGHRLLRSRLSRCQAAERDQIVRQDPVADPDLGAFGTVDAVAVPAVSAFEGADPAFDSGAPLNCSSECWSVFLGSLAS
jgi:hypothetical protein